MAVQVNPAEIISPNNDSFLFISYLPYFQPIGDTLRDRQGSVEVWLLEFRKPFLRSLADDSLPAARPAAKTTAVTFYCAARSLIIAVFTFLTTAVSMRTDSGGAMLLASEAIAVLVFPV